MNRHDTDAISLASGLVFLAFVGWWLLVRWMSTEPIGFAWFAGAALIVAGVAGMLAALISSRGRRAVEPPATDEVPAP